MKKTVIASALFLSLGTAYAAESPRWDFASASYQTLDVDGVDVSGLTLSGTKLINDDIFVTGGYAPLSVDEDSNVDYNLLSIGVGYRHLISETTDVFGIVSYESVEVRWPGSSAKDSGYGLTVGARSMVTDVIEVNGSIDYVSIDGETETGFAIGALYNVTDEVAVGASYSVADNTTGLSLTGAYFF